MKNVKKLACWPMLQKLGFEAVRYRINGKIAHVGACLKIENNELRIEPHDYENRPYHVSYYGKNVTCNIHTEARNILPLINDLFASINARTMNTNKTEFNRLAESLGCRARIAGTKKKIEFQMFTGSITSDGYEIVLPIDSIKFAQLIANYPELHY